MSHHHRHSHDHAHHIIPFSVYFAVFAALIVLTLITVWAATQDFGFMNTPIALLIASLKASLVLAFFMHLKYDHLMNRVVVGVALFFVFLLFFFSALDIWTRIVQTSTL